MEVQNRIMVIDDDEITRKSLKKILEEEGYETETAKTGREGVEKIQKKFFNIALLDIKLPDVEGTELLIPLKEMHPDMNIIMITGNSEKDSAIKALNRGAAAYILKPLDIDSLLGSIKGFIEKQSLIAENRQLEREIKKSFRNREKLENIINRSPLVVFLWECEEGWPVEYVSENIEQFGYTPEEFYTGGISYSSIIHPDDLERVGTEVTRYSTEGISEFKQEYRIITKNKEICWIEDRTWIRRDQRDEITHYEGLILDITERKAASEKLRQSEERMRLLSSAIEQSTEGIAVSDLKGNLIFANNAFSDMHGYTSDEIIAKHLSILHIPDQMPSVEATNQHILEQGEFTGEIWHRRKDGSVFPSLMHNSLFKDEMDNPVGFIGTLLNITEKKEAEEKLRKSEKKYRNLYEEAPNAYFSISPNQTITRCNKAAVKLLGYSKEELSRLNVFDLYYHSENGLSKAKTIFQRFLSGEEIQDEELQMRHKNGNPIWVSISVDAVKNQKGQIIESRSMVIDITERKKAEEALKESEEKYHLITENANDLIFILNQNMKLEYINENVLKKMLGFSKKDIIGKSNADFIFSEDIDRTIKSFRKGFKSGQGMVELRCLDKSGLYHWLEIKGKVFIDQDGETKGLLIAREITERKKREGELKKTYSKLNQIFNITIPLCVIDKKFNVLRINNTFSSMINVKREEIIGRKCYDIIPGPLCNTPECTIRQVLSGKELWDYEKDLEFANGIKIICNMRAVQYRGLDGEITGVIENYTDITKRKHMEVKLQESENKYRILFEDAADSILIVNAETGVLVDFNRAAYRNLGYNYEEFKQIQLSDIEAVENPEEIKKHIEKINSEGYGNFVTKHKSKDGKIRDIHIITKPITIREKHFLISMCRDITERKKIEDLLTLNKERYSLATNAAKVGVWDWNFENGEFYLDPNFKMMLGYSDEEIPSDLDAWLKYIHPDDSKGVMEAARAHLEGKTSEYIYEHRMLHKDGSIRWVQVRGKAIRDIQGNVIRMVGTDTDITAQKEAEVKLKISETKLKILNKELEQKVELRTYELKNSEEKIQNLINNISDVLMEGNIDGKITFISPQIYDIIGYQPKELIGNEYLELIHPEEKLTYEKLINGTSKAGSKFSVELRIMHKKGYYVPISIKGSIEEINNKLKMFVVIGDITEKRKIDEMMKSEIKKLKELDQIRSDLIRRISHELKTPLISIFSGSQYLLEHLDTNYSDQIQDIIKLIHMGGYRLRNLANNLIIAYNIESDEIKLNLKRENLIPTIKNCVEDISFQANKRKNFINLELLSELYVEVDKSMIKRAISNILSNAVKNTPTNGNIFVSTFEHPNYINIIVKDNGVGLTKKEILLLFKRFGKIERYGKGMDVDIEGVGLGLYITNEIVKLHNGEIIVKSKGRNKGSTFIIRLPIN